MSRDFLLSETNLPIRIINSLGRRGIFSFQDLIKFRKNNDLSSVYQLGVKSVGFLEEFIIQNLINTQADQSEVNIDKNWSIGEELNLSIRKIGLTKQVVVALESIGIYSIKELLSAQTDRRLFEVFKSNPKYLKQVNDYINNNFEGVCGISHIQQRSFRNWAEIFETLSTTYSDREVFILLSRFGYQRRTLENISSILQVTRERVRQIQLRIIRKITRDTFKIMYLPVIEQIINIMNKEGEEISLLSFENALVNEKLLGSFLNIKENPYMGKLIELETLFCYLNVLSKHPELAGEHTIRIDCDLLINNNYLSIKQKRVFEEITKKRRRNLVRRILYTGGIKEREIVKILNIQKDLLQLVIEDLNLVQLATDWYSLSVFDQPYSRIPIRSAGLKMLACISPMNYDIFHEGIRRYISRFYSSISPPDIMMQTLRKLGFSIQNQEVSYNCPADVLFSKSDICFIKLVKENGNVISFLELAEGFIRNGLSVPAVSIITKYSPIAEKIDFGLFKIRGSDLGWEEIVEGHNRQLRLSSNQEISHGLDGIIRIRMTISRYAFISGVLNSNYFKRLRGNWDLVLENEKICQGKIEESYLWGLSIYFKKMGVIIGDRVELAFNTWNRNLSIRRI